MFIKRVQTGFIIIVVYLDDLNILDTSEHIINIANYLKNEFEMKDFGKIKFCLGTQVDHL